MAARPTGGARGRSRPPCRPRRAVVRGTDDRDAAVLDELRTLTPLAPLHQPHNLAAIDAVAERLPDVPQVACFDTSFHRGQPAVAQLVPLPPHVIGDGVQRYGFHGLSYEYIASVLPHTAPEIAGGRVIVAHLGSGASLCALKDGRSVDSTLGFTALDGLCMGTRPGSLDPGVVLYLFPGPGPQRRGGRDHPLQEVRPPRISGSATTCAT
jgi:acetate kinase